MKILSLCLDSYIFRVANVSRCLPRGCKDTIHGFFHSSLNTVFLVKTI